MRYRDWCSYVSVVALVGCTACASGEISESGSSSDPGPDAGPTSPPRPDGGRGEPGEGPNLSDASDGSTPSPDGVSSDGGRTEEGLRLRSRLVPLGGAAHSQDYDLSGAIIVNPPSDDRSSQGGSLRLEPVSLEPTEESNP